jgi:ankyrin repeat protein
MSAICRGHIEIVHLLLKHDQVKLNHQNKDGDTALSLAIKRHSRTIVVELLKQDELDVNHQNSDGDTALFGQSKVTVLALFSNC